MNRKTILSKDFNVSEEVRSYCGEKWALPHLADAFLYDFKECFNENGRRHINWETTFKTFIRRASPSGPFYGYGQNWERKCEQARRHQIPGKSVVEGARPRDVDGCRKHKSSTWIPASPAAKDAMKHIQEYLKGHESLLK